MTSTQTHKVIMGIRSEHRGILGHEQNTSGNTIFFFSIVLVLFFCQPSFVLCVKNIAKKKSLFCGQCPKKILGNLRINLFFYSIGESGGGKNFKQFTKPSKKYMDKDDCIFPTPKS